MFMIGSVPYLNGRPLIEGLPGVLLRPPAQLAKLLASRRVDVALVSVIEAIRHDWTWVPGIAVASPGATGSVRLHLSGSGRGIRRVALDRNSRTSNVLARIILEKRYGLRPRYVMRDPGLQRSFEDVDAVLTIGDRSFWERGRPFLDLGAEWRGLTGHPFVYAVWAHPRGHPQARRMAQALRRAKETGMGRLGAIARREAARLGLPAAEGLRYLTSCITYDLGPAERAGLRTFERYARELSEI